MGATWLHSLPEICEYAGIRWRTWPGWETRSRSTGGYDQLLGIGVHHTASDTSPDSDCSYMWGGSPDEPIGAVLLDRDGMVTIGAAGATNTQGKGGPYHCSNGTIPLDSGNKYTFSVEAANAGTGEPWPEAQQDAYVLLCAALCQAYHLEPDPDCFSHFEWTDRKIDPAGASRYASGGNKWNMDAFRSDIYELGAPVPPVEPPPLPGPTQEIDMLALDFGTPGTDDWWTRLTYTGDTLCHVRSPFDQVQARGGVTVVSVSEVELNAMLDTVSTVGDSPFHKGGQAPNSALDTKWEQARGRG